MHEHSLTEGNVLKKLLLFALPILGANLLQALYGTVDLMIVGLFTEASEVSAVSTGSMTMQTITGIVIGLTMGCTVLLGNSIGMKDFKKASHAIASAGLLFVAVGALLTILIVSLASPISTVMNRIERSIYSNYKLYKNLRCGNYLHRDVQCVKDTLINCKEIN